MIGARDARTPRSALNPTPGQQDGEAKGAFNPGNADAATLAAQLAEDIEAEDSLKGLYALEQKEL